MSKEINYKDALAEVERIIEKIENGEPQIDELSDMVKRAATLIKACKNKLKLTEEELNDALDGIE